MPKDIGPSLWNFPKLEDMPKNDLVILGADLEPETLIDSYKHAIFPMHVEVEGKTEIGWWSPLKRGVLPLDQML